MPDAASGEPGPVSSVIGRSLSVGVGLLPIGAAAIACLWRPDFAAAATLVPPFLWLAAGFGSLLVGFRHRPGRFALFLTFLWIAFAVGWVEEVRSLPRSLVGAKSVAGHSAKTRIRVVSLNTAGTLGCLADLQRAEPDIVLLQESPGGDHVRHLAEDLFGREAGVLDGGDTALLARGTIKPLFVDKRGHFVVGVVSLAEGGELCCVSLRLDPPPSRFDAWSSGFWMEHAGLRAAHRRQVRDVVSRIAELSGELPLVIGGDFNTVPLDRALDPLRPWVSDAFARSGTGWGATGTNACPLFRVDQIWTGAPIVPLDVRAVRTEGSDHRMVICDLMVR